MKEIAKVKNTRYYDKQEKAAEVKAAIAAIEEVDKVLNVLEEKVAPYSYYIPMKEIVESAKDWSMCTYDSRAVLIAELNGCIDIINIKIRLYNEKDVTIRLLIGKKTGTLKTVKESIAEDYLTLGLAELV